jgi:hypothetical protein
MVDYVSREGCFMQGIVVSFRFNFRVEIWTDGSWGGGHWHRDVTYGLAVLLAARLAPEQGQDSELHCLDDPTSVPLR